MHIPPCTSVEQQLINKCVEPRRRPKRPIVQGFSRISSFRISSFRIFLSLMTVAITLQLAAAQAGVNEASAALPWQVTHRDFHSSTWESVVPIVDPISGQTHVQRHKFVSIGSGMNFLDENNTWQTTREELQVTPEGYAIGQFGPHKLIVENNVNSATALDVLTSDGVRLRMGPVAVGWFDPLTPSTNYILATIHDCPAEVSTPNEVIFRNCFQGNGLRASIRVSYRKAGVSEDLLIHEIADAEASAYRNFPAWSSPQSLPRKARSLPRPHESSATTVTMNSRS